jgi:hypothetical protein
MIPSRAAYQVTSDTDPPRYALGYWYTIAPTAAGASASAATVNFIRAYPWVVRARVRIQSLGVRITTGVAGLMQFGIYRANAATLNPMGDAMAYTGDIDVSAAQNVSGPLVQGIVTVAPGLHWFCYWTNCACTLQGSTNANTHGAIISGAATQAALNTGVTTITVSKVLTGQTYGLPWPNGTQPNWQDLGSSNSCLGQFQVAS